MDATNTEKIPHDESGPDEGKYHRDNFDGGDSWCFLFYDIHHSFVSEKYSRHEDDESFEYRRKSLHFPESIGELLGLSLA
jgi:hypothetical protein